MINCHFNYLYPTQCFERKTVINGNLTGCLTQQQIQIKGVKSYKYINDSEIILQLLRLLK